MLKTRFKKGEMANLGNLDRLLMLLPINKNNKFYANVDITVNVDKRIDNIGIADKLDELIRLISAVGYDHYDEIEYDDLENMAQLSSKLRSLNTK